MSATDPHHAFHRSIEAPSGASSPRASSPDVTGLTRDVIVVLSNNDGCAVARSTDDVESRGPSILSTLQLSSEWDQPSLILDIDDDAFISTRLTRNPRAFAVLGLVPAMGSV